MAEVFEVELAGQVVAAATGMHGAGGYRAQCGLVEGALMFLGIRGMELGLSSERIADCCREFAERFEQEFGSLGCRELRPEGFHPDNPPHLCEPLTIKAIGFQLEFVAAKMQEDRHG